MPSYQQTWCSRFIKSFQSTRDIRALLCPPVYHLLLRVMGNVENLLAIICELYMYYYTGNTNGVCVCVCVRDTQLCLWSWQKRWRRKEKISDTEGNHRHVKRTITPILSAPLTMCLVFFFLSFSFLSFEAKWQREKSMGNNFNSSSSS
jgi:hypothetical protein